MHEAVGRAPLRVRGPAPRRDQRPQARAAGRRPAAPKSSPRRTSRFAGTNARSVVDWSGHVGQAGRARRPRAQPAQHLVELPRDKLIVFTGLSGSGKSLARLRHDLRRGPAALRRVAVGLRPAVPRARWTSPTSTSSRGCRRPSRSTRSRRRATPARPSGPSPRSTTTCGCCTPASGCRTAPTTAPSSSARRPQQIVDRILELPDGTRFQVLAPGGAGPQGRVREPARGAGRPGLRPGPDRRRRSTSCRTRPSWPATSSTPSRWSSTGWSSGRASSGG